MECGGKQGRGGQCGYQSAHLPEQGDGAEMDTPCKQPTGEVGDTIGRSGRERQRCARHPFRSRSACPTGQVASVVQEARSHRRHSRSALPISAYSPVSTLSSSPDRMARSAGSSTAKACANRPLRAARICSTAAAPGEPDSDLAGLAGTSFGELPTYEGIYHAG